MSVYINVGRVLLTVPTDWIKNRLILRADVELSSSVMRYRKMSNEVHDCCPVEHCIGLIFNSKGFKC